MPKAGLVPQLSDAAMLLALYLTLRLFGLCFSFKVRGFVMVPLQQISCYTLQKKKKVESLVRLFIS